MTALISFSVVSSPLRPGNECHDLLLLFCVAAPLFLPSSVPAIDDDVGTGGVGARVAGEVDEGALQLGGLGVTAHGDHAVPELLDVLGHEVGQAGVNVAGGNGVDAGEVPPFVGETACQVDAAGFGDVVGCLFICKCSVSGMFLPEGVWETRRREGGKTTHLFLRVVGNVSRHAGRDDEAARLAFTEVQANRSRAMIDTGQVGLDDLFPLAHRGVEDAGVGGAAGIGDEDVDLAEVGDDVLDQLLDLGVAADVALVGLGLDAVLFGQLFGVLLASLTAGRVGDGDVGAHFGAATRGFSADASRAGGAGDNDHFAL